MVHWSLCSGPLDLTSEDRWATPTSLEKSYTVAIIRDFIIHKIANLKAQTMPYICMPFGNQKVPRPSYKKQMYEKWPIGDHPPLRLQRGAITLRENTKENILRNHRGKQINHGRKHVNHGGK